MIREVRGSAFFRSGTLVVCLAAAAMFVVGCSATKTQLGEFSARDFGNAWLLPKGFVPLVGLDLDNPNHWPDNWPRYIVSEADNMVMVYVDGGVYEMGEGPDRRKVQVDPYYIDTHEVTNSQFDRFRKDKRYRTARRRAWHRPWMESNAFHTYASEYYPLRVSSKQKMYPEPYYNFYFWEGQTPKDIDFYLDYWNPGHNNDAPARNVSWWEAMLYTMWTGKLLPTEAQWELAARGKYDNRIYPWGSDTATAGERCNSGEESIDDGNQYVASAMAYASGLSPYGCYNMSGNVWEWCLDNYDPYIARRPRHMPYVDPYPYEPHQQPGGQLDIGADVEINPVGPLLGDERVIRGGSYTDQLANCKVTTRRGARPDVHQMNVGFRCVLPLPATANTEHVTIEYREEVHEGEHHMVSPGTEVVE